MSYRWHHELLCTGLLVDFEIKNESFQNATLPKKPRGNTIKPKKQYRSICTMLSTVNLGASIVFLSPNLQPSAATSTSQNRQKLSRKSTRLVYPHYRDFLKILFFFLPNHFLRLHIPIHNLHRFLRAQLHLLYPTHAPHMLLALFLPCVLASIGDRLPQYQECVSNCLDVQCDAGVSFLPEYDVNILTSYLFLWTCPLDCDFKCRSHVTAMREKQGLPRVQFYGKWPFDRLLGVTEFFSTVFSIGNLWVNLTNLKNYNSIMSSMKASDKTCQKYVMLVQYRLLLAVAVVGWFLSAVFHTRDVPVTETLDYLGAGAIVMANFNAVNVRYFELFRAENQRKRMIFQLVLVFVLLCHYAKLASGWDYKYNMRFNVVIGLCSLTLWILHSLRVYRSYNGRSNTPMQLFPYETKIQKRLGHVCKLRTKFIPLIPAVSIIFLNMSLSLELFDFAPIWHLVDSHALWHLCTIFPPLVWFDWNLWDIELCMATKTA